MTLPSQDLCALGAGYLPPRVLSEMSKITFERKRKHTFELLLLTGPPAILTQKLICVKSLLSF